MTKVLFFTSVTFLAGTTLSLADSYQEALDKFNLNDFKAAIELWKPMAEKGDAQNQYSIGFTYAIKDTAVENHGKAIKWLTLAAEQEHNAAQYRLALKLYSENKTQAYKWFLKSAENGHSGSQYYIGDAYLTGLYFETDYTKAFEWLKKSADQGDASGQNGLGSYYFLKKEFKTAFDWSYKAATQGDRSAQNTIGDMYFDGLGTLQDYILAHMWTNIASSKGDMFAPKNLIKISEKISAEQIAEAQRMANICLNSNYKNADTD